MKKGDAAASPWSLPSTPATTGRGEAIQIKFAQIDLVSSA